MTDRRQSNKATAARFSACFIVISDHLLLMLFRVSSSPSLIHRWGAWKQISEVQINHIQVGLTGLVYAYRPRMTHDIRILRHELQASVVRIAPKGSSVAKRDFLN